MRALASRVASVRAGTALIAVLHVVMRALSQSPQPADPHVVLKASDDAIRGLNSITYDAEAIVQSEASNAQTRWRGRVGVRFTKERANDIEGRPSYVQPIRVEYTVHTDLDRQGREYLVISDGGRGIWVDRGRRIFRRGRLPAEQSRIISPAEPLLLNELFAPAPLEEAQRNELRYVGRRRVEGVDCDVINISDTASQSGTRWYFGVEDHLPRRVERRPSSGRGPAMTLELRGVTPNAPLSSETFAVQPPDGCAEDGGSLLARGSLAPPWTLSTLEGLKRTLADQQGSVSVIVFWASWNPASATFLKELGDWKAKLGDAPVRIFLIAVWEEGGDEALRRALGKSGAAITVLHGTEDVLRAYRVTVVPTVYVVDRDGRICFSAARLTDELTEQVADAATAAATAD